MTNETVDIGAHSSLSARMRVAVIENEFDVWAYSHFDFNGRNAPYLNQNVTVTPSSSDMKISGIELEAPF
jgi:hypothetical protein